MYQIKVLSIFTVVTGVFDIYSLAMAAPGSTHFGYYFISYQFVYVGNKHGELHIWDYIQSSELSFSLCRNLIHWFFAVRNTLILFAMFSVLSALTVLVSSIMLIIALRKVCHFFFFYSIFPILMKMPCGIPHISLLRQLIGTVFTGIWKENDSLAVLLRNFHYYSCTGLAVLCHS